MSIEAPAVATANAALSLESTDANSTKAPTTGFRLVSPVRYPGFLASMRAFEMHRVTQDAWLAWMQANETYATADENGTESNGLD